MLRLSPAATPSNLSAQPDTVTGVAKTRPQYRCSECHHVTAKWVGRCPDCGTWGTVDEVAVLGVPLPDRGGEVLRAVIACSPGRLSREEVLAWCREHLASHKIPRSLILLPALPRTSRGKLDRAALLSPGGGGR